VLERGLKDMWTEKWRLLHGKLQIHTLHAVGIFIMMIKWRTRSVYSMHVRKDRFIQKHGPSHVRKYP
jgi:hypothetical protein